MGQYRLLLLAGGGTVVRVVRVGCPGSNGH